jgi:hypothetical protein
MIDPGESATINLEFIAHGPESLNATLWLVGDDPYNPDVRIPVTMNVLNPFFLPIIQR